MTHEQVEERFLDFLEEQLSEEERREFSSHLESCIECRDAFEQYKTVMRVEKRIAESFPLFGESFADQVLASAEERQKKVSPMAVRVRRSIVVPAAALAATALLAMLVVKGNQADWRAFMPVSGELEPGPAENAPRYSTPGKKEEAKQEQEIPLVPSAAAPIQAESATDPNAPRYPNQATPEARGNEMKGLSDADTYRDLVQSYRSDIDNLAKLSSEQHSVATTKESHNQKIVRMRTDLDDFKSRTTGIYDRSVNKVEDIPGELQQLRKSQSTAAQNRPLDANASIQSRPMQGGISLDYERLGKTSPSAMEPMQGSQDLVTTSKRKSPMYTASGTGKPQAAHQPSRIEAQVRTSSEDDRKKAETAVRDLNAASAAQLAARTPELFGREAQKRSLADEKQDRSAPPVGYRAMTLSSESTASAVEGWARPGTKIDVIWWPRGSRESVTLAQGITVLSTSSGAYTITASEYDAARIEAARNLGKIVLVLSGETYMPPPAPLPPSYGEQYGHYEENLRTSTAQESFSTFSLDVDTGSYSNARRFLQTGQLPPPDSVRIEEFLNYFRYSYPEPEDSFGINYEIAPAPFDRQRLLLKVGIKAKEIKPDTDSGWNLVFLIDRSGSMSSSDKLPLIKQGLKGLAAMMRPIDRISIVTYADTAKIELEGATGNDKTKIFQIIDSLQAYGSTNGAEGLEIAYETAKRHITNGGVNRVVLATDGDFNVGNYSFSGLMELIENQRKSGVTLTTLGFGTGNYNERNLEQLADRGDGAYHYIDKLDEASRVLQTDLVSNMQVVAKDAKVQVEFNPSVVKEYRLIGYDNRKLDKQDFSNDAVDAGEVGAGSTVTALYELLLYRDSSGEPSRYAAEPPPPAEGTHLDEIGYIKLRFKEPNAETSKLLTATVKVGDVRTSFAEASNDFRFAAAVSEFGHHLRRSRYSGTYNAAAVLESARQAKGEDLDGSRAEFLSLLSRSLHR